MPATPVSLDSLRLDVADVLGEDPADLPADEDLRDLGVDSIRLMTLVERWRARGLTVDFAELAEAAPTLDDWHALLAARA
ncbi:phosphopantetheine-binding protein [Streptomyces sp. I05A-00742]|uniref:phosphopantetheine-binding protein n=1 Tax=Streptomyces sp. I05A-00742 TaxID=2732853 RepID=UPI001489509B|nr:phosphopantetheine-binding protein [Streptomyces sp. I05A-00742]